MKKSITPQFCTKFARDLPKLRTSQAGRGLRNCHPTRLSALKAKAARVQQVLKREGLDAKNIMTPGKRRKRT